MNEQKKLSSSVLFIFSPEVQKILYFSVPSNYIGITGKKKKKKREAGTLLVTVC